MPLEYGELLLTISGDVGGAREGGGGGDDPRKFLAFELEKLKIAKLMIDLDSQTTIRAQGNLRGG